MLMTVLFASKETSFLTQMSPGAASLKMVYRLKNGDNVIQVHTWSANVQVSYR
jgi:hypothetical protein